LLAELVYLGAQGVALGHDARQLVVAGSDWLRNLADRLVGDGG